MLIEEIQAFLDQRVVLAKVYERARVIDPVQKKVITQKDYSSGQIMPTTEQESCFDYWGKGSVCENCVSIRAFQQDETLFKIEYQNDRVLLVTAVPLDWQGRPLVLELFKDVTNKAVLEGIVGATACNFNEALTNLNDAAVRDAMTGVYNRRFIDERLNSDVMKALVESRPLAVILADIDFFKKVNDNYGHIAGDIVIKRFATVLSEAIRINRDWVARYGGEEFFICLPNTPLSEAARVAERVREDVEGLIITAQQYDIAITASFGVAALTADTNNVERITRKADANLYEAKRQGRNRVIY